jgi:hypothetical protein
MAQVVIFENDSGGVYLLNPLLNCGLTLEEIALKDVPENKRFKIIDDKVLPDFYFYGAWEYDFKDHDGVGLGADKFWATVGAEKLKKFEIKGLE